MKYLLTLLLLFFLFNNLYSQEENIQAGDYSIQLNNSILTASKNDSIVYKKTFLNTSQSLTDLDNDGVDELIIIESSNSVSENFYTIYIYSTLDSFFLADSIYSGITLPYQTETSDVNGTIIITGIPNFDFYNQASGTSFSPFNCWKYESGEVFLINDEVYDLFITENDSIIDYLDEYFKFHDKNCTSVKEVLGAVSSVYVNYLNAGENSAAKKFLSNYYFCLDGEKFKSDLDKELIKEEK